MFTIRRAGGMVAAAACMALMVWLWNSSTPAVRHAANRVEHLAVVPGDLDASGRVDILDAYRLAKAIQSGDMPSRGDVNSDGAIDSADVEALAMLAVRLEGAG